VPEYDIGVHNIGTMEPLSSTRTIYPILYLEAQGAAAQSIKER